MNNIISAIDSPQLHNGYYVYNNKIYTERIDILNDIVEQKDSNGSTKVKFYFHDNIFENLNWQKEPSENLSELYKNRAIQLRDTYKNLILSYSGGYDSHEVLMTFVKNKIPLDEIQILTYEKLLTGIDEQYILNKSKFSCLLEYKVSALANINKIKHMMPDTKITLIDGSDLLLDDVMNNKFALFNMHKYKSTTIWPVQPWTRLINLAHAFHNEKIQREGTAVIFGTEKPKIEIIENNLFFRFSDAKIIMTNFINNKIISATHKPEYFYWSKDAPYIPIKQCHILFNALKYNQKLKEKIRKSKYFHEYERDLVPFIYFHHNEVVVLSSKITSHLFETELIKHHLKMDQKLDDVLTEYVTVNQQKYDLRKNRQILTKPLSTKRYFIGKV